MATVPEYVFRIPGRAESTGRGARVTVSATRAAGAAQTLRAREGDVMARLQAMQRAYTEAAELARAGGEKQAFHPRTQTACAILLGQLMAGVPLCSQALRSALIDAHDALVEADAGAPDFWSAVGAAELEVYRHVAIERLDRPDTDIAGMLARVAERDTSVRKWASVRDTFDILVRVMRLAGADKQQIAAARKLLAQVQAHGGQTS